MRVKQSRVEFEPIRPNPSWVLSQDRPMTPRGTRVTLYLPELSDSSVKVWHRVMRDILGAFEDHYQQQLARAYGWAPLLTEDEDGDDDDDDDWDETL